MEKDRISVVLICGFSNAKVRAHLPLDNRKLYNIVRRLLGMPIKSGTYGDVAAWDTHLIENMRLRDDVELHVISSHSGMKKGIVSFVEDRVDYHFVRCERATFLKRIIPSAALWHKMNPMRPVVRKIVRKINPDIIALVGAENPHISGTVVGLDEYPLIVKCQTIYNNPDRKSMNKKNAYVEKLILEKVKYAAVNTKMHYRMFRQMNNSAYNFYWDLGNVLPEFDIKEKRYDFVNFAMSMIPNKGFPDAIRALAIVKKSYPEVKLNLVGGCEEAVKKELEELITELGLQNNVEFTPFFPLQEDLFRHIQYSRFAVLPCKLDSIPGTIRQSMHYGLPVVCYRTTGTPSLNTNKVCVLIADNGNVEDLATKMLILMNDEKKAKELKKNAKELSDSGRDDARIISQIVDNFKAVIANYKEGTPIPEKLMCRFED